MKRMLNFILITLAIVVLMLSTSVLSTSAATTPTVTFTLISGLPEVMNVGDTATVVIQIDSDQPFISAMALGSEFYPGRGVVQVNSDHEASNRSGRGTTATLSITYKAKGSTASFAGGVAPVSVIAGARYGNDGTFSQEYDFNVQVP